MNIFVSIAAYRDPQLLPTLCDCIVRARHPEALRFGICWQHGPEEAPPAEFADPRVRVIDVPWRESRGACWARAEIQKLYDNEDFYLQIDSHHRFVQDWDVKLLEQAARSGAGRPILSTYCAGYNPADETPPPGVPVRLDFDRFTEAGIPVFRPTSVESWKTLPRPPRARFVSAHFLFAPGRFVTDVPYDPELYFIGEEITLSVRAYTHGYDLFHPTEHILWHEYTRAYRTKHWDDHVRAHGVEVEWHVRDAASVARVRRFLTAPEIGRFGCGTARSVADYEAYAGLSFVHCAAQDATLQGAEPPNPPLPPTWPLEVRDWHPRIVLDRATLPPAALDAPRFWYVGFHDSSNVEIYRKDADVDEINQLAANGSSQFTIQRGFRSMRRPVTWTVWPVGTNGSWMEKTLGKVDVE